MKMIKYYYTGKRLGTDSKLIHVLISLEDKDDSVAFSGKMEHDIIGTVFLVNRKENNTFTHEPSMVHGTHEMLQDEELLKDARDLHWEAQGKRDEFIAQTKAIKELKSADDVGNYTLKELKKHYKSKGWSDYRISELINIYMRL